MSVIGSDVHVAAECLSCADISKETRKSTIWKYCCQLLETKQPVGGKGIASTIVVASNQMIYIIWS